VVPLVRRRRGSRLLAIAAAVERRSDHPLARAVVDGAASGRRSRPPEADEVAAITGFGLRGGRRHEVLIGKLGLFTREAPDGSSSEVTALQDEGRTVMLVRPAASSSACSA
jgi:cation transport ATPase